MAIHKEHQIDVAEKLKVAYNSAKNIWNSFVNKTGMQFAVLNQDTLIKLDTSDPFMPIWNKYVG